MKHALLYQGAYERNFQTLKAGAKTFTGSDGKDHNIEWPKDIDGVHIGFMEKPGKHFVAVRVQHGADDIVLENALLLDQGRHLGGERFAPGAIIIDNDSAKVLLEDAIARNESQKAELAKIRMRLSTPPKPAAS